MSLVRISAEVLEQMIDHARSEYPVECCGLLSGRGGAIDGIRPTRNQRQSAQEFFVPVRELFDFFKDLRRNGREHLGVYHSHPRSDAYPSVRDTAEFHYPEVSYWVISLRPPEPEVRCFRWTRIEFRDCPFEVVS